jgi:hypothetical protein
MKGKEKEMLLMPPLVCSDVIAELSIFLPAFIAKTCLRDATEFQNLFIFTLFSLLSPPKIYARSLICHLLNAVIITNGQDDKINEPRRCFIFALIVP